ncbi:MAG: hypothetical protein GC160_20315 [Acidobacteria bacterium]|nr:hypothetical protein [Acidobacteriota bacterium]
MVYILEHDTEEARLSDLGQPAESVAALAFTFSLVWFYPVVQRRFTQPRSDLELAQELRKRVQRTWIEGLLEPALDDFRGALSPPVVFRSATGAEQEVGSDTPLRELVLRARGQRLIVSGPRGSGKSIFLLRYAKELINAAPGDPQTPAPILLNVSTWVDPARPASDQQSIRAWVEGQLLNAYGIPSWGSQRLIENDCLAYCLDGFDELMDESLAPAGFEGRPNELANEVHSLRTQFLECLNAYIRNEGRNSLMLIASRSNLVDQIRTVAPAFRDEIAMEPLDEADIRHFLKQNRLTTLRSLADIHRPIKNLLTNPLYLKILATVYPAGIPEEKSVLVVAEADEGIDRFLREAYQSYFNRKVRDLLGLAQRADSRTPEAGLSAPGDERRGASMTAYEVRRYAAHFANYLRNRRRGNVFRLDELQPSELPPAWRSRYLNLASAFLAAAIFITAGTPVGIAIWLEHVVAGLSDRAVSNGLLAALGVGVFAGGTIGLGYRFSRGAWLGAIVGLAIGLARGVVVGLAVEVPDAVPWLAESRAFRALIQALAAGPTTTNSGLEAGLLHGLVTVVAGVPLLALALWRYDDDPLKIRPVEAWETEPRRLAWLMAGAVGFAVIFAVTLSPTRGVAFGIALLLVFWVLFGRRPSQRPLRIQPNQGIRYSLENATSHAIGVAAVCSLTFGMSYGVSFGRTQAVSNAGLGWAFLVVFIFFGGFPVIQHSALRCTLALKRVAPLDYVRFLLLARRAGLLRQAGGAFGFPNEEFIEHCSDAAIDTGWGVSPSGRQDLARP